MYAQLCKRLSNEAPNFETENHPCTFRLLLLNKCKAEFENRSAASEALDQSSGSGVPSVEEEERRLLAKRKMLGNIKFIGELAKLDVLSPNILHKCIQQLLIDKKRRSRSACQDMSEDIECLCQILRTCGRILDNDLGQCLMVQYFERMKQLAECSDLPPRIRFMLKDVIELRSDGWVPRKATTVEGPMPINQIRPSDDDPRSNSGPGGVYMSRADRRAHDRADVDRLAASELFGRRKNIRAGFEDMLANISLGSPSTNLIPTHSPFNPNGYGGGGGGPRDGSYRGHNNQRSGYIYGTPASTGSQRNVGAFNKHGSNNQHSNNSAQYNNASNKDLAPRFKKGLIAARDQNLGDLELRPAANSMLFNQAQVKAQVNSNMVMNSRLMLTPDLSIGTAANINKSSLPSGTPLLKDPLPIKQTTIDKPKQTKKDKGPNKEEVLKKLNALLDEYLQENITLTQAVDSYKEHKVPDKYAKDAMLTIFNNALNNKTDSNREKIMKLIGALRTESLVGAGTCQEAIKNVCNRLEEGEREGGLERGAAVLCYAVRQQVMTLSDVATLTENGLHHPLFLVVLQRLHKALDKQELLAMFNASKVNLMAQLPEADRSKERLAEILEERELTFLYPLLRVQAEMARQLAADPTPAHFYKWIKENLEPASYTEAGFINALITVLLKHVMAEAGSVGADPADKAVAERERALLERYTDVLQHFLHERVDLQVTAVYSLQAHCHALGFPKGLLLRWFIALYDLEVVEEDAFLHWKEDLNDAYPGKGQALFQVHQWLTWLQEAESEDDEADD